MRLLVVWLLAAISVAACATRPSHIREQDAHIIVKSVRIPDRDWLPWYTRFAEHCWIDVRDGHGWHRLEWNQHTDDVAGWSIDEDSVYEDIRWERGVAVHGWFAGDDARLMADRLLAVAVGYPDAAHYRAWPGANSNSFVTWLARKVDLPLQLPPNAVGKDYTPWLRVGLGSGRSGIAADTAVLGAAVGLREGLELHVIGLTVGVGIWPPQFKLPFLPAVPWGWL